VSSSIYPFTLSSLKSKYLNDASKVAKDRLLRQIYPKDIQLNLNTPPNIMDIFY